MHVPNDVLIHTVLPLCEGIARRRAAAGGVEADDLAQHLTVKFLEASLDLPEHWWLSEEGRARLAGWFDTVARNHVAAQARTAARERRVRDGLEDSLPSELPQDLIDVEDERRHVREEAEEVLGLLRPKDRAVCRFYLSQGFVLADLDDQKARREMAKRCRERFRMKAGAVRQLHQRLDEACDLVRTTPPFERGVLRYLSNEPTAENAAIMLGRAADEAQRHLALRAVVLGRSDWLFLPEDQYGPLDPGDGVPGLIEAAEQAVELSPDHPAPQASALFALGVATFLHGCRRGPEPLIAKSLDHFARALEYERQTDWEEVEQETDGRHYHPEDDPHSPRGWQYAARETDPRNQTVEDYLKQAQEFRTFAPSDLAARFFTLAKGFFRTQGAAGRRAITALHTAWKEK